MGSENEAWRGKVTLSPFWIMDKEVTNRQYERFRPKHRRGEHTPDAEDPVAEVSHDDALAFAAWLGKKDGKRYGLPSEAQWEYAARGGLEGKEFPWGDESPDGRCQIGSLATKPVGSFPPNGYGLYDMAGNVWEFVREADYDVATLKTRTDPVGPTRGDLFIKRGGGCSTFQPQVYFRALNSMPLPDTGFRLVVHQGS